MCHNIFRNLFSRRCKNIQLNGEGEEKTGVAPSQQVAQYTAQFNAAGFWIAHDA